MNEKSTKRFAPLIISVSAFLAFILIAYFGLSIFYHNKFSTNTWVNGIYCTGLNASETLELLTEGNSEPSILIVMPDGKDFELDLSQVSYSYDYGNAIESAIEKQNEFLWFDGLWNKKKLTINPTFSISESDLKSAWENLDFVKAEINSEATYTFYYSDSEKKYVCSNTFNDRFDYEKAFDGLHQAILSGKSEFVIEKDIYFYNKEASQDQKDLMTLFGKIDEIQNCDLIYDMGAEKIEFTPEIMLSLLMFDGDLPAMDEDGKFILDEEAVADFVQKLCDDYDSYCMDREFTTTRGDVVSVQTFNYGTKLDYDAEYSYLINNLLNHSLHNGSVDYHIPTYNHCGYSRGMNDLGGSYIEVDITNQTLYLYKNYELLLKSDIVSGDLLLNRRTIIGLYCIQDMQEKITLYGADYADFVYYWMRFYGGYGLHDATWRDEFGGEIYKTNGSHGCVNLPLESAATVYENIELGYPVVIYY